MRHLSLAALAAVVLSGDAAAAPAPAETKANTPIKGPAPVLGRVGKIDADKGTVEVRSLESVSTTRTVYVVVPVKRAGGTVEHVPQARNFTDTYTLMKSLSWSGKTGQALDGQGKKIADELLWQRLRPGETVLYLDADAVDSAWLRVLKPDAVILMSRLPKPPKPEK